MNSKQRKAMFAKLNASNVQNIDFSSATRIKETKYIKAGVNFPPFFVEGGIKREKIRIPTGRPKKS